MQTWGHRLRFLIADLGVSPAQLSHRAGLWAPPGTLGRCLGSQWPAALWAAPLWVPAALWVELIFFSSVTGVPLDVPHAFYTVDFLMKWQDVPGSPVQARGTEEKGLAGLPCTPAERRLSPPACFPLPAVWGRSRQGPCPPLWRWGRMGSNVVVSLHAAGGPVCSGAPSFFSGCESWAVGFYLDVEGSGTIFWAPKHD